MLNTLSEEHSALRDSLLRFARRELNQEIAENEKEGKFPFDSWHKCAEMQVIALPFPERYGGGGGDFTSTVLTLQTLGYACRDAGLVHALATQILCGLQLLQFGTEELKERFLPPLCRGEKIFAQAMTEPGAGSDAFALRTRAQRENGGYRLCGNKVFITNGPIADVVSVFALTNPGAKKIEGISCFIVGKEFSGFERSRPLEKLGLNTLQNGELIFADCFVPEENLLGREGQGAILFNESMEWEKSLLPAAHLGTLERVYERCLCYARERSAFDQPIGKYQAIAHKITQMKIDIELGKLILYQSAFLKDSARRAPMESSVCKLFISESLKRACLDAVQIHGAYGYSREYEIERDLRDSIAATIYSGTSEMQHNIISRLIGL